MREPRPDWSPSGVNFKILDDQPFLSFLIFESPPPPRENLSFERQILCQILESLCPCLFTDFGCCRHRLLVTLSYHKCQLPLNLD